MGQIRKLHIKSQTQNQCSVTMYAVVSVFGAFYYVTLMLATVFVSMWGWMCALNSHHPDSPSAWSWMPLLVPFTPRLWTLLTHFQDFHQMQEAAAVLSLFTTFLLSIVVLLPYLDTSCDWSKIDYIPSYFSLDCWSLLFLLVFFLILPGLVHPFLFPAGNHLNSQCSCGIF